MYSNTIYNTANQNCNFTNEFTDANYKLIITYWDDLFGKSKVEKEFSWVDFVGWLKRIRSQQNKKDSPLIKLAIFGDSKTSKGSLRHDQNVQWTTGIEGDLDTCRLTFDQAKGMLEQANVKAVVATTWSHTPESPKLRVFAPLSGPRSPDERSLFVARLNGTLEGNLASESFNISQSFFIGGNPENEYRVEHTFDDPEDGYYIDTMSELDEIADYGGALISSLQEKPQIGQETPEITAARKAGLEPEHVGGGKWILICPWRDQHTKETNKGATAYFEPHTNGYQGSGFKCMHDHCSHRNISDFNVFLGLSKEKLHESIGLRTKDIVELARDGQKGCAKLFTKLYQGVFCYDHADGKWYRFTENYWESEETGDPIKALDKVQSIFRTVESEIDGEMVLLGKQLKEVYDRQEKDDIKEKLKTLEAQKKTVLSVVKNLNNLAYRKQTIEFAAQGEDSLGISGRIWDTDPWVLACANGVVDLKTGNIRDGKPEDYLKSVCPTPYNPEAKAPRFEQFLDEIFASDKGLIAFVQRIIGMALIGSNIEHNLIVLWGAGRNGKDTLLGIIKEVLGSSLAGAIQSELLLDQDRIRSSSGPSPDVMRLRGLRLVWASETKEGRQLDAGKVKLLTGGGDLAARAPYGKYEITFPQSHTLFLLTNSKPHAPADDYALWKRLILIPFEVSFVENPCFDNEKKADKHLTEKLKREKEGILNWAVQGCLQWQEHGLKTPATVEKATKQYQNEEDILQQFIEEACVKGSMLEVQASSLYQHYRVWSQNNGLKPMDNTSFGRKMSKRFNKTRKSKGAVYQGIALANR